MSATQKLYRESYRWKKRSLIFILALRSSPAQPYRLAIDIPTQA
jgi:hypothetical protein